MRPFTPTLLLAGLVLTACQQSPQGEPAASAAAWLSVDDGAGKTGPFRLDHLARLSIAASYAVPPGVHAQRIDVIDPHGLLYGTIRRNVEGGPGGVVAASEALEVRGTTIDSYRMLGRWQFVLVVDDVRPLAAATVELTD